MWKDSIRNIVVIFQPDSLRIVGFYVRHSANMFGCLALMSFLASYQTVYRDVLLVCLHLKGFMLHICLF